MISTTIVTLVLTMSTGEDQFHRHERQMDSISQCLEEAAKVLENAAKVEADHDDQVQIGAGCVIKLDPGPPA